MSQFQFSCKITHITVEAITRIQAAWTVKNLLEKVLGASPRLLMYEQNGSELYSKEGNEYTYKVECSFLIVEKAETKKEANIAADTIIFNLFKESDLPYVGYQYSMEI